MASMPLCARQQHILLPVFIAALLIDTANASAPHPAWAEPMIRFARKGGPIFIVGVLVFILALLFAVGLLFVFLHITVARSPSTTSRTSLGRSAAVVVLGDVGRSPRMCLHAQSLAEDGWRVALVGYQNTPPPPPLRRSSVKQHHLYDPFAALIKRLPRTGGLFGLVTAPLKVIGQSGSLFWTLATQVKPPPELIIVQTPPALPALFIVRLVGMLLGTRIVIDWHNLGFSILAMRFRPESPFVRTYRLLERVTGGRAFTHLCVTRALKQHLEQTWRVAGPVKVLYDRPPSHFRRATTFESHDLLKTMVPKLKPSVSSFFSDMNCLGEWSPFTQQDSNGVARLRADRPALVVSSTSWTADEDFGMLLRAASLYEARARELNSRAESQLSGLGLAASMSQSSSTQSGLLDSPLLDTPEDSQKRLSLGWSDFGRKHKLRRAASSIDELPRAKRLPKMLLVVTGKGELQGQYLEEIARIEKEENWQWVRIRTTWLQSEDYPTLLGSADVGVSLHASSSGMDLPMKVVDMLGCGLPVCALGFPCIGELVRHGSNGLVFYSEKELAIQLESLLCRFPGPSWLAERTSSAKTLFPEDLLETPPMSMPGSPALSHSHDLPFTPSVNDSPSQRYPRPSSPIPIFTLLQSPALQRADPMGRAADDEDLGAMSDESKARTWARNWKRVVRPLIAQADEEDAAKERQARFAHVIAPTASSSAYTSATRFGIAQRANAGIPKSRTSHDEGDSTSQYAKDPRAGLALLDEAGMRIGPLGAASGSSIFTRRHRRSNAAATTTDSASSRLSGESADASFDSSFDGTSHARPRSVGHLRQRTNTRDTRSPPLHGHAEEDSETSVHTQHNTIPGIHISAPPT